MEYRIPARAALGLVALVSTSLLLVQGAAAAEPRPKPAALGAGTDDATLRARVDQAAEILLVERTCDSDIRPITSLKGGGWYRDKKLLHKEVKPALLARPAEEKSWVIFLPWRDDHPAMLADRELCTKIEGMVAGAQQWSEAGEDQEIGLRAKHAQFTAGDEIEVEIHTRNRGRSKLKLPTLSLVDYPHYPFLKLTVTAPDGKVHELWKQVASTRRNSFPKEHRVAPGESLVETLSLDLWRADGPGGDTVFAKPGDYQIQFSMPRDRVARLATAREEYLDH